MTILKDKRTEQKVVFAYDYFMNLKTDQDFRSWLADKIINFEMEEGTDYVICLSVDAARELLKYEPPRVSIKISELLGK
jgi:phage anti-repressor protein